MHYVHLRADFRTWTQVRCDSTVLTVIISSHSCAHGLPAPCFHCCTEPTPTELKYTPEAAGLQQHCPSETVILLVSYLHYVILLRSCKEVINRHKESQKLGKCRKH